MVDQRNTTNEWMTGLDIDNIFLFATLTMRSLYTLMQRFPTTGPRTGTGPWAIWYRAAQKKIITLFPFN